MNAHADFWSRKADQFERLHDPTRPICAEYDPAGHSVRVTVEGDGSRVDPTDRWVLSGGSPAVITAFKSLAAVAAVALGCADDAEAWSHWLDYIRRHSEEYRAEDWDAVSASRWPMRRPEPEHERRTGPAGDYETSEVERIGQIASVCEASARFCRRLVDEQEKASILGAATNTSYPTPFARNVDHFRLQCGWTYEELSEHVRLARSMVFAHVKKGALPRPSTVKRYADAFAKQLKEPISPADLMADVAKPDSN
jgi:hypothetical protein